MFEDSVSIDREEKFRVGIATEWREREAEEIEEGKGEREEEEEEEEKEEDRLKGF
jgi:hypothetical protein